MFIVYNRVGDLREYIKDNQKGYSKREHNLNEELLWHHKSTFYAVSYHHYTVFDIFPTKKLTLAFTVLFHGWKIFTALLAEIAIILHV